jgi:hypothetical protein
MDKVICFSGVTTKDIEKDKRSWKILALDASIFFTFTLVTFTLVSFFAFFAFFTLIFAR